MAPSRFPGLSITCFVAALLAGCTGGAPTPAAVAGAAASLGLPSLDRRGAAHAPIPNAAGATVEYFGGSVTANAKVYVVWWGDPSKINATVTAAKGGIADFYAGVLNSNFMDWLNQYSTNIPANAGSHSGTAGPGQIVGRGNYVGAITLSNVPSGNSITDAQIQSALDAGITAGTLPPPDANTIYAVYFPSGLSISLDGTKSCQGFGAYHEAILETGKPNVNYLVMPDCGSSFKGWTSVSTHELIEAVTDNTPTAGSNPDYPQAWNDSMGNEVGDLCESSSGTVNTDFGTFTVQSIWDNRSGACKAFSTDAKDFSLAVSPNVAAVALNAPSTFTVKTTISAGAAQSLTLSVTAPTGVTATVSPTTIMSGGTAALTVTATNPPAQNGLQVIVRADASGTPVQSHTAALLLSTGASAGDMGPPSADLGPATDDLGHGHDGADGGDGSPDDMATSGTGGNGNPPPLPGHGCAMAGSADASAGIGSAVTLLLLAFLLLAFRRRQPLA